MPELCVVKDLTSPFIHYIKDDPVRPEIAITDRLGPGKEILVLHELHVPLAIVCVAYQNTVPTSVSELLGNQLGSIAVFYTIWSYSPGAGKDLLSTAKTHITECYPHITRFVTLSPPSDLARKFHLGNGATILSENSESVNYEYH